jgi:hypothetical protein
VPSEPLGNQARHFLECVRTGDRPLTDGPAGLDVVSVMEAIDRSLAAGGAPSPVEVTSGYARNGNGDGTNGHAADDQRRGRDRRAGVRILARRYRGGGPMMRVPFVDLPAQYAAVEQEVEEAVRAVHRRGDYILGQDVRLFEEEFAAYCEADHAIGVDSGVSALELACGRSTSGRATRSSRPRTRSPPRRSRSPPSARRRCSSTSIRTTHNLDPALLAEAVTARTRAIMPVHLHGRPAAMDEIMAVATSTA